MCHCAIMLLNSYSNHKNEDFNWSIRTWKSYDDFCIKQHKTKTAMGRGWKNYSDADRNVVAVNTTSAATTTSMTSATLAIDTVATTSETGTSQENIASVNTCGGKKAFEPNSSQTNCNHSSPEAAAEEENDTVCIHYDTFGSDSNDIKERIQFQVRKEEENDEENEETVIENWYDALEEGKEDSEQNKNFMKNKYGETNSKETLHGKANAINALVYQTNGIREIKEEIPYDWKDPIPKSQEVPPKEISYWQPLIIPPLESLECSRRTQTSRKGHAKNKRKFSSERSGSTNYYNGNVDYSQSSGRRGQDAISTNSFGQTYFQNRSREFDTASTPPKFMRSISNCRDGGTSLYTKGKLEDSFRFNGQGHTQYQYFGQNVALYRDSQNELAVSASQTSGANAFPSDGNNNIVWPSTCFASDRYLGFPIAREEEKYSRSLQEISYDHYRDDTENPGESYEWQYNFSSNLHNREEATNEGRPCDLPQTVNSQEDAPNIQGSSGWQYDFSNLSSESAALKQTKLYREQPSFSDILYDQIDAENEAESFGQQYDLSNLSFSQKETTNNTESSEQQYILYDLLRARETARKAENFQGKPGFHFLFGYGNPARRAPLSQWQYNSSAIFQGGTGNKTDLMLNRGESGNYTNDNHRQYHGQKQTGLEKNSAVSYKQSLVSRQDIYVFLLKMALTAPKKWNVGNQKSSDESNGQKRKKGDKCLPGIFRKETNQNDSTKETMDIKEKNEGNGPSQTGAADSTAEIFGAIGSERRYRRSSNDIQFSLFTSPLQQESGRDDGLGDFYPQWPLSPTLSKASNEVIMYNGRNILDLGQNIRDPSWQLNTPQMDVQNLSMFIDNRSTYHRLSKFAFNDDPSLWVSDMQQL
ncbi:uncharacterized protein [Periplaneta americana]|uniref:uncharacterized protein isoform X2 n=1 Tax=Periplaneta americana TaxID=6978 RepID=UPI0037E7ECED